MIEHLTQRIMPFWGEWKEQKEARRECITERRWENQTRYREPKQKRPRKEGERQKAKEEIKK